jgi:3-oxoacyl-[acyl-carrier protein] reductase
MQKKNKNILVTGTSSGIGKKIAQILLEKNYNVIGVSRKKVAFRNLRYKHLNYDISNRENDNKILKILKKNKIKLDGIVNNAGTNLPNKFSLIKKNDYDIVMKTNLEGPFFLTQKLIQILKAKASIVNISSFSAISGGPVSTHYAISKSGIEALTKNLAITLQNKKIRVNAISPGLIKTKMAKHPQKHPFYDRILAKRPGRPIDIANVTNFLLSENSDYINGQIINVDGGMFFR